MNVVVNGEGKQMAETSAIADAITDIGRDPSGRGIAVAINGEVVPRSEWESQRLQEGDRLEVLNAVGGG